MIVFNRQEIESRKKATEVRAQKMAFARSALEAREKAGDAIARQQKNGPEVG